MAAVDVSGVRGQGHLLGALTVIWMSSVEESTESETVRRNTYTPATENDAVVDNADAFPNVTVPGPDTFDHVLVNVPGGFGSPSSDAVPDRDADDGNVTVLSVPAFTVGAWFTGGLTVIWMSSDVDSTESETVKRSTYTPVDGKDAVVDNDDAFPNVTFPEPETFDHVLVNVPGGFGSPSSDAVPDRDADDGNVTVLSTPAFTTGAWFGRGFTVIWMSSHVDSTESDAVKRNT